jgi:putative CRISPR-associated protein (TIGR02619 family)
MTRPSILICTIGTSLFANLKGIKPGEHQGLATAFAERNWQALAGELAQRSPDERVCGAEINSVASMIEKQYVQPDCGLFFLHSDTEDGRNIADVLVNYYRNSPGKKHAPVKAVGMPDLQEKDPKRFRTKGLRNLARKMCGIIREYLVPACAINATGGYKAQIAIAVLLGQALAVQVYYKFELFPEIIPFPPMPVSLDFELWMRASGILFELGKDSNDSFPVDQFEDEWQDHDLAERLETLVEREQVDGVEHVTLSPTGEIFHEAFRERFRTIRDQVLPPPATQKRPPRLEQAGWSGKRPEVEQFMIRVTDEVPQVEHCATFFYNPDRPNHTLFRVGSRGIEGIYSDGRFTVKFRVETTAKTPGQQAAMVAELNSWLAGENRSAVVPVQADDATQDRFARLIADQQAAEELLETTLSDMEAAKQRAEAEELKRLHVEEDLARAKLQLEEQRSEGDRLSADLRSCRAELAFLQLPWWKRLLRRRTGSERQA